MSDLDGFLSKIIIVINFYCTFQSKSYKVRQSRMWHLEVHRGLQHPLKQGYGTLINEKAQIIEDLSEVAFPKVYTDSPNSRTHKME